MTAARKYQRGPVVYEAPVVDGRVPPHDLDFEATVLESCIFSQERRAVVMEVLEAKHFYSIPNKLIFEAVTELERGGEEVSAIAVVGRLRARERLQEVGGTEYVVSLGNVASYGVERIQEYADRVRQLWVLRELIARCQRIAAEGYGDVGTIPAFVDSAEQMIYDVAHVTTRASTEQVGAVLRTVFAQLHEAAARGDSLTGTPTGFERYDQRSAGLHGGDLTIIAARPGMGKTALAMSMAVNVACPPGDTTRQGKGVAVFSLEMPRAQLVKRMICAEGRVDAQRMRTATLLPADWSRLTEAANTLSSIPLWIDDTANLTLLNVRAKVRRARAQSEKLGVPLGLVVIDYLQLMQGRADAPSREQEVSELSRGLKLLAKELDLPFIVLSQLNREVEKRGKDKRPQLSDLRESGAIEQDADNIVFIYRDDYYNPETTNQKGIAEVIFAKQRSGATGKVLLRFDASCTRFDNLDPRDYPEDVGD